MSVILVTLLMAMMLVVGLATEAQDAVHSTASSTTGEKNSVDRPVHSDQQKLEKEIALLKKKVRELISTVKELQQELDYTKTYSDSTLMLVSAVGKLENDFVALNTKTDNNNLVAKSDVSKLQTNFVAHKSKTENNDMVLKSDVSKFQRDFLALEAKIENNNAMAKSNVGKLQSDFVANKAKTEKNNVMVKFDVGKLQNDVAALEAKTESNNAMVKSNVGKLQSDFAAHKAKADNHNVVVKSDISKLQSDFAALKAKTENNNVMVKHVKSDVSKLQSDFVALKSKTDRLDQHVYFLATFQASTPKVKPLTVIFDKVLANTGNAYNARSGMFTAPLDGLYVFTVQAFSLDGGLEWDLHINEKMVLRDKSHVKESNNNYVYPVSLKSGERVSVFNMFVVNIWGANHSFMAGWLIKAL